VSVFDQLEMTVHARGLLFPEGPVAAPDGTLLVVEIEGGSVARIAADGSFDRLLCGGGPNGAALGPDGALYVANDGGLTFTTRDGIRFPDGLAADNPGGAIQRLDLVTGRVETIVTESGGARLGSLNDVVFDTQGLAYVVDTGRGLIHHVDVARRTARVAASGLELPNGMGLSPDGRRLYVAETYTGRIFRFDVTGPGRLEGRAEHFNANGAHGWDGLAVDGRGNVCAANLEYSGISVIAPDGSLVGEVRTPLFDSYVTNICFAGADLRTAYICSSGRGLLYALPWPWPGLRPNFC
jgi:gluconolactonase